MTKDQLAKDSGCKTYDCALPQKWLDKVVNKVFKAREVGIVELRTYHKEQAIKKLAAEYDTKIQKELEEEKRSICEAILCGTVWCYDGSLMGFPKFLTPEAKKAWDEYITNPDGD